LFALVDVRALPHDGGAKAIEVHPTGRSGWIPVGRRRADLQKRVDDSPLLRGRLTDVFEIPGQIYFRPNPEVAAREFARHEDQSERIPQIAAGDPPEPLLQRELLRFKDAGANPLPHEVAWEIYRSFFSA
jgi:hypothetical protein